MKAALFILLSAGLITVGTFKAGQQSSTSAILNKKDSIDFKKQIQPILVKNCSPCHFTGGKMYERMPFDKAETIINHQAGILRRIKKEDENELLKQFMKQGAKL